MWTATAMASPFLLSYRLQYHPSVIVMMLSCRWTQRISRQAICQSSWTRGKCRLRNSVNTCPTTPASGRYPETDCALVLSQIVHFKNSDIGFKLVQMKNIHGLDPRSKAYLWSRHFQGNFNSALGLTRTQESLCDVIRGGSRINCRGVLWKAEKLKY